jgi:hypothetical protein
VASDGGSHGRRRADPSIVRSRRRLRDVVGQPGHPDRFERRRHVLGPGVERPSHRAEWADTIVLIERGRLEVCCEAGSRVIYEEGDLLPLGWLPLRALRNPGMIETRLMAIRRRASPRLRLGPADRG